MPLDPPSPPQVPLAYAFPLVPQFKTYALRGPCEEKRLPLAQDCNLEGKTAQILTKMNSYAEKENIAFGWISWNNVARKGKDRTG